MESCGILFVATGKKYINAAIRAAKSVQKHCPEMPVHLYANWQDYDYRFDLSPFPFTSTGKIEEPHRRSKIDYLSRTPFDRTLYLDTDTALNADIRELFQLLDRFDVALGHAHRRNSAARTKSWRLELPQAYPQFNSGVLVYKKTPQVLQLLQDWAICFKEAGFPQDQVTLRELLWLSDLRIATLPPEYNVRFMKYHYLWSKSEAVTKIFHLRKYHGGSFRFLKTWLKKIIAAVTRNNR
jgi:hypothetical protein